MPKPSLGRLLIVDDEIELAAALSEMLTLQGYEAVTADSAPPRWRPCRRRTSTSC